MNTRKKKLAFPLLLNLHIEIYEERKAHSSWGLFKFIFIIHNLQNSFICSGALAAASNDVRKIASSQSSSSLSFSADARKGGGPFPAYRPPPTANPTISFASVASANGGSWIAGSRRLPLFPRKEGQARAELPHREPLTMHANRPLKDIACVLHAQTKDATVVCVIGCQITRTRIHTLPKRLASARHSRVRKLYSYQIHSARFKQTSQWRRKSWWCILPAALILWYAGSDVMGCRRPTGGVFSYVSSDRVTLRAFPVATPRGRSSSSHEGELPF